MKEYIARSYDNQSLIYSESNDDQTPLALRPAPAGRKIDVKTPVMRSPARDGELRLRIEKLGLETVMRELIVGKERGEEEMKKVIFAFNKTYLAGKVSYKPKGMTATLAHKSSKNVKKKTAPSVSWNPEKVELKDFEEIQTFIPNQMFPIRNNQTRLLKSRQKFNRGSSNPQAYSLPRYHLEPTLPTSMAAKETPKRPLSGRLSSTSNPLRRSTNIDDRRAVSARGERIDETQGSCSSGLLTKKAKIYK